MRHFLFLRHGPVAEKYRKIFYGQLDIPLSEEGKRKSLQVVNELANYSIKAVFSSPLQRALFPAKILAEKKRIPLIVKEELKEINYRVWTGRLREEVYKEPLFWKRLRIDNLSPHKGESIKELRARAKKFWEDLVDLEEGLYSIFTHGGFIRALLCELLAIETRFFLTFEVYHLKGVLVSLSEKREYFIRGINLDLNQIEELIKSSYW